MSTGRITFENGKLQVPDYPVGDMVKNMNGIMDPGNLTIKLRLRNRYSNTIAPAPDPST